MALKLLDTVLGEKEYLVAGGVSAADITTGRVLQFASSLREVPEGLPMLEAYVARCAECPAFQKAFAD